MIEFDKHRAMELAWNRFKRSNRKRRTKAQRESSEKRWIRDVECIAKIASVIDWCVSKNVKVEFGKLPGGSYNAIDKTIKIACRAAPEKQLYMLLHECGHHLIGFAEDDERFGMGYPYVQDSNVNSTFHHRIACLEEEMEAWNRGWRLGKRLHLQLERPAFDEVRLACLRSYVKWANGRTLMITE